MGLSTNVGLLSQLVGVVHGLSLPPPTGPYNVGSKAYVLNHTTFNDPSTTPANGTTASILINVYYPTHDNAPLQYYIWPGLSSSYDNYYGSPSGTWGNITANIAYNATPVPDPECQKVVGLPTLMWGPPFAGPPSQMFLGLIGGLVSQGYTVVTNDHPSEQPYLQYPNGTGFAGHSVDWSPDIDVLNAVNDYRNADNSATLDALPTIAQDLNLRLNLTHFAYFGHSLGGSVALSQIPVERNGTESGNKKFLGAINLDGSMFGRSSRNDSSVDVKEPTLLFASSGHQRFGDPTWPIFESWQTSWRKEIRLLGNSNHTDFSDLIFLKQANGVAGGNGSIPAARALEVSRTFVRAFFDMIIGEGEGVLAGSDEVRKQFPEISFEFNGTGDPCASQYENLCWAGYCPPGFDCS